MNLFSWLNKKPQESIEDIDIIKPLKEDVLACLNGESYHGYILYARQYVNFFRELEGLPLLSKEDGQNADIYLITPWMYDMCKKYKHLFEDEINESE